jgi:hypothetical protein
MKSKQEAKLSMYDAVITYCEANAAITVTIPAFTAAFAAFKASVAALRITAQKEADVISGVAMDKFQAKKDLAQVAATTAAAVYALASANGNNQLKEQVNFSVSDLLRFKDELLTSNCQNIHDLANTNLAALAPYGITAGTLSALNTEIGNYAAVVPAPRNAASLRSAYSSTLVIQFKEADDILKNQLDKIAAQFKTTVPEFYMTYKNNRIILDPGSSNTQVAGTVTNSSNGDPLSGVLVKNESGPESATTGGAGEYELKIATPGTYNIIYSKDGFHSVEASAELNLGKTTTKDVAMNPL